MSPEGKKVAIIDLTATHLLVIVVVEAVVVLVLRVWGPRERSLIFFFFKVVVAPSL